MIRRKKGKLSDISRLVPCSVAILSVATKKRQDAMTASAMFVSESVPLLVVSVAKHIVSHDLIEEAGEFALSVASTEQVKLAKQLGFTHGREVDKFRKFRVPKMRAKKVRAPLVKGAFAHIECKVITSLSAANYVIYLAEVVNYRVDPKRLPVTWYNNKYFAPAQQVL